MITREEADALFTIARGSIAEALGAAGPVVPDFAILRANWACFVTLHRGERLHGCIGSFEGRALGDAIRHNAYAAAFEDPRATPLAPGDVDELEVEISLLSRRAPLEFESEEEARRLLRPGVDGLVLQWGPHRGVFLPQVWEGVPRAQEFLDQLKLKAGLPKNFWAPDLTLERFTVEKLVDPAPALARAHRHPGG